MYNIFLKIFLFEEFLIKKLQDTFGSPEKYRHFIKVCKFFSKSKTQKYLLKALIFLLIFFNYNKMTTYELLNQAFIYILEYIKIIILLSTAKFINQIVKNSFKIKRPYVINNELLNVVITKDKSKSFSFPSNSVQNSFIFYNVLFKTFFYNYEYLRIIIVSIMIIYISFIKMLRALHYPHDILASIILGRIILYYYFITQNFLKI